MFIPLLAQCSLQTEPLDNILPEHNSHCLKSYKKELIAFIIATEPEIAQSFASQASAKPKSQVNIHRVNRSIFFGFLYVGIFSISHKENHKKS